MAERDSDLHRSVFVQLVISVCHANARRLKSRPTEAPRSHLYHPQFPRVRGKPPSDTPACGGSPLLIPPRAGEAPFWFPRMRGKERGLSC